MTAIIGTCNATGNNHFVWFAKLLDSYFEEIIAYASIPISSGRMEGINNKFNTLHRQAYGFPDDEYFFLKPINASRKESVRNPVAYKLFPLRQICIALVCSMSDVVEFEKAEVEE